MAHLAQKHATNILQSTLLLWNLIAPCPSCSAAEPQGLPGLMLLGVVSVDSEVSKSHCKTAVELPVFPSQCCILVTVLEPQLQDRVPISECASTQ